MSTREGINVDVEEQQALLQPVATRKKAPFWQVALALVIVQVFHTTHNTQHTTQIDRNF